MGVESGFVYAGEIHGIDLCNQRPLGWARMVGDLPDRIFRMNPPIGNRGHNITAPEVQEIYLNLTDD